MLTDIIYPAQGASPADIAGVWQLVSWQCDGGLVTSTDYYTQMTVLDSGGRFFWASIERRPDGRCVVDPLECGTCNFIAEQPCDTNGVTQTSVGTGRAVRLSLIGFGLMHMALMQERFVWRRRTDIPQRLTDHIINCCRAITTDDLQELIKRYCLNCADD